MAAPGEKGRGHGLQQLADLHHPLPVIAVGGMPGDEDEQRHRQKLRQPDQPEMKGAARHLVDLPAKRDGAHLRGKA